MKLLTELMHFLKKQQQEVPTAEEDDPQRLERIRAKAAAYDKARQQSQANVEDEGGVMDPRKAKALMAQGASASPIPQTPGEQQQALTDYKSAVTRMLSSYVGKAKLEKEYASLRKQGDHPFIKAKRQIAFNALTSGSRGQFESAVGK